MGEEIRIGRRLRVFWPLEDDWFEGVVDRQGEGDDEKGKWYVVYNDGDEEVLDLSAEKIEWLDDDAQDSEGSDGDPPARANGQKSGHGRARKTQARANIIDDS
eukprot:8860090-Pyramimonas_sp.AAC.2